MCKVSSDMGPKCPYPGCGHEHSQAEDVEDIAPGEGLVLYECVACERTFLLGEKRTWTSTRLARETTN